MGYLSGFIVFQMSNSSGYKFERQFMVPLFEEGTGQKNDTKWQNGGVRIPLRKLSGEISKVWGAFQRNSWLARCLNNWIGNSGHQFTPQRKRRCCDKEKGLNLVVRSWFEMEDKMNRDSFFYSWKPSKEKSIIHNLWAGLFTALLFSKAITYFSVGKNQRKKVFLTDICLTISFSVPNSITPRPNFCTLFTYTSVWIVNFLWFMLFVVIKCNTPFWLIIL